MRKALKTVLCVALILALTAVVALRVLPPMDTPAQSAAATPTPVVTAAPTPTPEPDNGLPKVNTGSWELTLVNAQNPIGEAVPEDLAELIFRMRHAYQLSVLLIEHDMPFVNRLCERVMVLEYGKPLFSGLMAEAIQHPDVISAYLGEANYA